MTVQNLYLAMVIAAFMSFGVTLFTVSLWSKTRRRPRQPCGVDDSAAP